MNGRESGVAICARLHPPGCQCSRSVFARSTDELLEQSRKVATDRGQAIEAYIRLYIEATGLPFDKIELCEQRQNSDDGIAFSWFCRPRVKLHGE